MSAVRVEHELLGGGPDVPLHAHIRPTSNAVVSLAQRIWDRGPAAVIVVLLHVLAIIAISAHRIASQHAEPAPIMVDFVEARPDMAMNRPTPPHVAIERTTPTMVMPEAPVMAAAQWEIAPAPPEPIKSQPVVTQTAQSAPIVEARFDADYLKNPSPTYPPLSRRMREQGLVILRVRVSEDGAAREVTIHQHSGHSRLDEAALATVRKWRFIPARRGDVVMESWVLVPIEFALNS